MKHLFVPYQLAKLAKEKGFDEPCLMQWHDNELKADKFHYNTNTLNAPLYQQLVDWFREKHGIEFIKEPNCEAFDLYLKGKRHTTFEGETVYKALTAALTKAFELI